MAAENVSPLFATRLKKQTQVGGERGKKQISDANMRVKRRATAFKHRRCLIKNLFLLSVARKALQ